jgi:hypothetical protein
MKLNLINFAKNNNYVLLLVLISCLMSLWVHHLNNVKNDYLKLSISKGDTVWDIAEAYNGNPKLDNSDFVRKIERINQIDADNIKPGQKIIIPVKKNQLDHIHIELYAGGK